MFYILDAAATCSSPAIANILSILKKALGIIQLVGPILGMVGLAINFSKLMVNPDEKKYMNNLKNCIIAMVALFFIPMVVNVTMGWLDDSFDIAACWNNAESAQNTKEKSQYNNEKDKDHQPIITPADEYSIRIPSNIKSNTQNS